jgi:hypothetical protein
MDQADRPNPGRQKPSWRNPTPKEKTILGFLAGAIGVLSGVAQFLGTYIHNGLALFAVCLLVVCAGAGLIMAAKRLRRLIFFTAAFLVAVVVGGAVGYLVGQKSSTSSANRNPPGNLTGTSTGRISATPSSQAVPGTSRPIDLSAKPETTWTILVDVVKRRPPTAGRKFWLVVQVHGVNGHSEFYPNKDLSAVPQSYSYELSIPDEANLQLKRTGRVFEVDESTAERFKADVEQGRTIPDGELTKPPCDDCAASPEIDLPFTK